MTDKFLDFSYNALSKTIEEIYSVNTLKNILGELQKDNMIKIHFVNGYYQKLELLKTIPIPKFITLDMTTRLKEILSFSYIKDPTFLLNNISTDSFTDHFEIKKSTAYSFKLEIKNNNLIIDKSLFSEIKLCIKLDLGDNVIKDINGMSKFSVQKKFKCSICNSEDDNLFNKQNRTMCNICFNKKKMLDNLQLDSLDIRFFNRLLTKVRDGARKRDIKVNISSSDLYDLYIQQKGLCYYTNLPFNLKDKNEIISIDRIDSSKDYSNNNIVLCLLIINLMKNDLSLEQFKYYIKNVKIND